VSKGSALDGKPAGLLGPLSQRPLSGVFRKSHFVAARTVLDPERTVALKLLGMLDDAGFARFGKRMQAMHIAMNNAGKLRIFCRSASSSRQSAC
jgi:hypothetical protein